MCCYYSLLFKFSYCFAYCVVRHKTKTRKRDEMCQMPDNNNCRTGRLYKVGLNVFKDTSCVETFTTMRLFAVLAFVSILCANAFESETEKIQYDADLKTLYSDLPELMAKHKHSVFQLLKSMCILHSNKSDGHNLATNGTITMNNNEFHVDVELRGLFMILQRMMHGNKLMYEKEDPCKGIPKQISKDIRNVLREVGLLKSQQSHRTGMKNDTTNRVIQLTPVSVGHHANIVHPRPPTDALQTSTAPPPLLIAIIPPIQHGSEPIFDQTHSKDLPLTAKPSLAMEHEPMKKQTFASPQINSSAHPIPIVNGSDMRPPTRDGDSQNYLAPAKINTNAQTDNSMHQSQPGNGNEANLFKSPPIAESQVMPEAFGHHRPHTASLSDDNKYSIGSGIGGRTPEDLPHSKMVSENGNPHRDPSYDRDSLKPNDVGKSFVGGPQKPIIMMPIFVNNGHETPHLPSVDNNNAYLPLGAATDNNIPKDLNRQYNMLPAVDRAHEPYNDIHNSPGTANPPTATGPIDNSVGHGTHMPHNDNHHPFVTNHTPNGIAVNPAVDAEHKPHYDKHRPLDARFSQHSPSAISDNSFGARHPLTSTAPTDSPADDGTHKYHPETSIPEESRNIPRHGPIIVLPVLPVHVMHPHIPADGPYTHNNNNNNHNPVDTGLSSHSPIASDGPVENHPFGSAHSPVATAPSDNSVVHRPHGPHYNDKHNPLDTAGSPTATSPTASNGNPVLDEMHNRPATTALEDSKTNPNYGHGPIVDRPQDPHYTPDTDNHIPFATEHTPSPISPSSNTDTPHNNVNHHHPLATGLPLHLPIATNKMPDNDAHKLRPMQPNADPDRKPPTEYEYSPNEHMRPTGVSPGTDPNNDPHKQPAIVHSAFNPDSAPPPYSNGSPPETNGFHPDVEVAIPHSDLYHKHPGHPIKHAPTNHLDHPFPVANANEPNPNENDAPPPYPHANTPPADKPPVYSTFPSPQRANTPPAYQQFPYSPQSTNYPDHHQPTTRHVAKYVRQLQQTPMLRPGYITEDMI